MCALGVSFFCDKRQYTEQFADNQVEQLKVNSIDQQHYDIPSENRNGEFDLVTEDQRGYIFYEVKFRREPLTLAMIQKEIAQVQAANLNCYKYAFISRSGFDTKPEENMIFISLRELYG